MISFLNLAVPFLFLNLAIAFRSRLLFLLNFRIVLFPFLFYYFTLFIQERNSGMAFLECRFKVLYGIYAQVAKAESMGVLAPSFAR